jgi:glycosyltransferase involved in cell wall biosynthesis
MSAPASARGGFERFADDLTTHLPANQVEVVNVSTFGFLSKFAYRLTQVGSRRNANDAHNDSNQLTISIKTIRKIRDEIDVLYVKNDVLDLTLAKIYFRRIPTIIGVHTVIERRSEPQNFQSRLRGYLYSDLIYKPLVRGQNRWVHCVADNGDASRMRNYLPGRVFVLPNYVTKTGFRKMRQKIGLRDGTICFLFVGRLEYQKGIDLFLDAVNLARSEGKNWRFVVAGIGNDQFEKRVLSTSSIDYRGYCEDISELMDQADWMVIPSRWEQSPLIVREAVANGLPYIVSSSKCFEQFFLHDCLVCDLNAKSLFEAMAFASMISDDTLDVVRQDLETIFNAEPGIEEVMGSIAKIVKLAST